MALLERLREEQHTQYLCGHTQCSMVGAHLSGMLFQLKIGFWASESSSGGQMLRFSARFCENRFSKNCPNKREHKIRRVIKMGGICHFPDPKPYGPFYLPSHVIPTLFRFSS